MAVALQKLTPSAEAQTRTEAVFVAAGEDRFHDEAVLARVKLSARDTNGALCVVGGDHDNHLRAPGVRTAVPLHIHYDQDEFWYIVEGEYMFLVGDRKIRAKDGDALFGPRRVPHSIRQLSERGSLLSLLWPAGTIEEFNREAWQLLRKDGGLPPPERVAQLFRAHGMEIVGPVVEQ